MNTIFKNAILNAVSTALYIAVIASFLFYGTPKIGPHNTVLIPIVMLSLFVFSAAVTGILVFGRPVLWYLDGRKREALSLLGCTLGIFLIITIIAFFALYFSA